MVSQRKHKRDNAHDTTRQPVTVFASWAATVRSSREIPWNSGISRVLACARAFSAPPHSLPRSTGAGEKINPGQLLGWLVMEPNPRKSVFRLPVAELCFL